MEFELACDHKNSSPLTLLLDFVNFHLAINVNASIQLYASLSGAMRPALDNTLKIFWISWKRLEKKNKEDRNLKMHGLLGKIEKMCLFSLK